MEYSITIWNTVYTMLDIISLVNGNILRIVGCVIYGWHKKHVDKTGMAVSAMKCYGGW